MFKQILAFLFPQRKPFVMQQAQTEEDQEQQHEATKPPQRTQQTEPTVDFTTPHYSEVDLLPENFLFYEFLLGKSSQSKQVNPLELDILKKVERFLERPEEIVRNFPAMPASLSTLNAMLGQEEFDMNHVVTLISKEPSVASSLIKYANSSKYKRGRNDITDLTKAFMLIGAVDVKEYILNQFVRNFTRQCALYFRLFGEKIWQHSQDTANTAKVLAKQAGMCEDTAFMLGLIHDLGKIVIFQTMSQTFSQHHPDHKPDSAVFKKMLNDKSLVLSAHLVKYWQLPDIAVQVSRELAYFASSDAISDTSKLISKANAISELKLLHENNFLEEEQWQKLVQGLNLSPFEQAEFLGTTEENEKAIS